MAQYPVESTFGKRIELLKSHKIAAAIYAVDKFLGSGMSVFISDGSSSFYVGLELFCQARENIEVRTNNLAIAHEYSLWPQPAAAGTGAHVSLAGGAINKDLVMVCGATANEYVRKASEEVQYMVLSVRRLFGDEGPTGVEFESLQIKQFAATSTTASIIVLADYEKLSHPFEVKLPRVYRSSQEWAAAMKRSMYVISTCRPDVEYGPETLRRPPENPSTPKEYYLANRWRLDANLGKHFIELMVP